MSRALQSLMSYLVPDHTRDALFQLACDLRANPIKDKHWVLVHWRRLKPRTLPRLDRALLYNPSVAATSCKCRFMCCTARGKADNKC